MLRIHFTTEDLTRVRVLAEPHPMWELLLSLHLVQTDQGEPVFGAWRRRLRTTHVPAATLLKTLARPRGYSPDFLTSQADVPDLDSGLESLLSTPRARLRADMTRLADQTTLPTWAADVADGEPTMLAKLADALRAFHTAAVGAYWPNIRHHVRADRTRRAETAMAGGFEAVLATLHPAVRWRAPVLEVDYPLEQDLHLDGRGLVLVPSFFCWRTPITLSDQSYAPMLVYPVERDPTWPFADVASRARHEEFRSLSVLLGRTRAAVLRGIAERPNVNTSELARATGISVAGASQHATVLRNAGLVTTTRHGGSAVHLVSARGMVLLGRLGDRVW